MEATASPPGAIFFPSEVLATHANMSATCNYDPTTYTESLLAASSAENGGRFWQMLTLTLDPEAEGAIHVNYLGHKNVLQTRGGKAGATCAAVANAMLDSGLLIGEYAHVALLRLFLSAIDSAKTPPFDDYDRFDKDQGYGPDIGLVEVHEHSHRDGIPWLLEFCETFKKNVDVKRLNTGYFLDAVSTAANQAKAERTVAVHRYSLWMQFKDWRKRFERFMESKHDLIEDQFEDSRDPETGKTTPRSVLKWRLYQEWKEWQPTGP